MKIENLKKKILEQIPLQEIFINGNEKHIYITAVGDIFKGKSNIKKQQMIYKPLIKYITEKKIHAITIDTFNCKEWKKKNNILQ